MKRALVLSRDGVDDVDSLLTAANIDWEPHSNIFQLRSHTNGSLISVTELDTFIREQGPFNEYVHACGPGLDTRIEFTDVRDLLCKAGVNLTECSMRSIKWPRGVLSDLPKAPSLQFVRIRFHGRDLDTSLRERNFPVQAIPLIVPLDNNLYDVVVCQEALAAFLDSLVPDVGSISRYHNNANLLYRIERLTDSDPMVKEYGATKADGITEAAYRHAASDCWEQVFTYLQEQIETLKPLKRKLWSEEEEKKMIQLLLDGVDWVTISERLPSRTLYACRRYYNINLSKKMSLWDKNCIRFAALYERMNKTMLAKIADMMCVPQAEVEAMYWQMCKRKVESREGNLEEGMRPREGSNKPAEAIYGGEAGCQQKLPPIAEMISNLPDLSGM